MKSHRIRSISHKKIKYCNKASDLSIPNYVSKGFFTLICYIDEVSLDTYGMLGWSDWAKKVCFCFVLDRPRTLEPVYTWERRNGVFWYTPSLISNVQFCTKIRECQETDSNIRPTFKLQLLEYFTLLRNAVSLLMSVHLHRYGFFPANIHHTCQFYISDLLSSSEGCNSNASQWNS